MTHNGSTAVESTDLNDIDLPPAEELTLADTGAGSLVFHRTDDGRDLLGFVGVDDWDAIRDAVVNRGHAAGDVLHLPEFETDAVGEGA